MSRNPQRCEDLIQEVKSDTFQLPHIGDLRTITASDNNARSRFGIILVCCDIDLVEIDASQEPSKSPRYPSRGR